MAGESEQSGPIAGMASGALEGFVSKETLQKVSEIDAKAIKKPETPAPAAEPAKEVKTPAAGAQEPEKTPAAQGAASQEPAKGKEEGAAAAAGSEEEKNEGAAGNEPKSKFGLGKQKKQTAEIAIEKPEDLLTVIKSDFGQEYKEIKEVPKFLKSAKKWREDSQKLVEVEEKAKNFESILEGLPEEFIEGIKLHYKGEDYMTAFSSKPKFNFSLPVEKQKTRDLVDHYFPGKFKEEDFAEDTPSEKLEIAIIASKDKYTDAQKTIETQRAQHMDNAKKAQRAIEQSIGGSVNSLKQNFPEMEEEDLQEVTQTLKGGQKAIMGIFFNADGTFKPEAAEMLMFAKHGKSEILRMAGVATHIAETKTNEDIVTRGADKPDPSKRTGGKTDTLSKAAQTQLNELKSFNRKTTY